MTVTEKVNGRWPRGTRLRCPSCNRTAEVAMPTDRLDCIGGMPAKHVAKEMVPSA